MSTLLFKSSVNANLSQNRWSKSCVERWKLYSSNNRTFNPFKHPWLYVVMCMVSSLMLFKCFRRAENFPIKNTSWSEILLTEAITQYKLLLFLFSTRLNIKIKLHCLEETINLEISHLTMGFTIKLVENMAILMSGTILMRFLIICQ